MLHFVDVQPSLRDDVICVLHTCNILHHRYTSYEYTVRGTFFWGAFVPERNLSKMSHHWRQAWWFSRLTSLIMIALENNWLARTFPIQLISHQLNSPTNWLFWMGIHTTVVLNTKPHNRKDVKTSRFLTLTQYFCVKHVEEPYLKKQMKNMAGCHAAHISWRLHFLLQRAVKWIVQSNSAHCAVPSVHFFCNAVNFFLCSESQAVQPMQGKNSALHLSPPLTQNSKY